MTEDRLRLARKSVGMGLTDHVGQPDMRRMRGYRMARFQAELRKRDLDGAVLYDPINIRYATGSRNMAVWTLHNAARYAFVPAEGKAVIFDFHNCEHLADGLETVKEARGAMGWTFFCAGPRMQERAREWAEDLGGVIRAAVGNGRRIGFDHIDPLGHAAMTASGFEVLDAQEPIERARAVKNADELACISHSIAVCEAGIAEMRAAIRPGVTENELFAILSDVNMKKGGEWMECRLLSSGGRTNPWFQEASDRIVRPGDLVAFDTDIIGPFGYCCDISRTFHCGPGRPSAEQRRLYGMALEQLEHNIGLVRAGLSFREYSEKAWTIPERFVANRYSDVAHGVGLADEYPKILHPLDYAKFGFDGQLEENMTICVESYIGEEGGTEGVKLEQQVLVTATGCQLLSTFPFEESLGG